MEKISKFMRETSTNAMMTASKEKELVVKCRLTQTVRMILTKRSKTILIKSKKRKRNK